jgi:hypothetical protein
MEVLVLGYASALFITAGGALSMWFLHKRLAALENQVHFVSSPNPVVVARPTPVEEWRTIPL